MSEKNDGTGTRTKIKRYINEFTPRANNKLYSYGAVCYIILMFLIIFFSVNHWNFITSLGISFFGSLCVRARQIMFNCCNGEDISSPGICVGNYLFFSLTGAITTGLFINLVSDIVSHLVFTVR